MKNWIYFIIIIIGYCLVFREVVKYMNEYISIKVDKFGWEFLINIVKIFMSSKIIGVDFDFFLNMVVDVMQVVKIMSNKGEIKYLVKVVNIFKVYGKGVFEFVLVKGYVFNCIVVFQVMVIWIIDVKIVVFDMNFQKECMKFGV